MKFTRRSLNNLAAVSLMMFLTSCCCHRCKQSTCLNLIQDGSFESPVCSETACSFATGQMIAGVWTATLSPVGFGLTLTANTYNPNQFHPTTDGNQFMVLRWAAANPDIATLTQPIQTELQAGHTYHLTFLQSAYQKGPSIQPSSGAVKVELVSSSGSDVLNHVPFTVPAFSDWLPKTADITIPTGGTGHYTLKFSSLSQIDPAKGVPFAANIDAVSLCESP